MTTSLLAGGLLAFALSFDEIIVTTFTVEGGFQTLPLWIFQNMFRDTSLPAGERHGHLRGDRDDHPRLPGPTPDRHRRRRTHLTVRRTGWGGTWSAAGRGCRCTPWRCARPTPGSPRRPGWKRSAQSSRRPARRLEARRAAGDVDRHDVVVTGGDLGAGGLEVAATGAGQAAQRLGHAVGHRDVGQREHHHRDGRRAR